MTDWISVKDRLPVKDGDYLVYAPAMGTMIKVLHIIRPQEGFISYVTHWQPLPEPPKEVDDD